jgi:signal transduction histidine kinase
MESLSTLTGGIVHDYNNMLSVILGYAELLQAQLKYDPTLFNYADTIVKSAERGSALSKKLLSISRRDSNEKDQHDINHLVADMQQILEKLLDVNIQLEVKLDATSCQAQLDAGDFNDALLNLCTNAKYAMPKGGRLSISSQIFKPNNKDKQILQLQEGNYIQLSITDTGAGMDEAVLSKIFDPFYTTKGEEGTGLGMTQVYGFMQRSHGTISVDSSPGAGSSFYLYFPLASALVPEPSS